MLIRAMGGRTVSPIPSCFLHQYLEMHKADSLKQNSWRYFTWRQGIKHSARKEPMRAFLTHDPNKKDCVSVIFSSNMSLDEPA